MTSAPITEVPGVQSTISLQGVVKKGNATGEESLMSFSDAMKSADRGNDEAGLKEQLNKAPAAGAMVIKTNGISKPEQTSADKDVNATDNSDTKATEGTSKEIEKTEKEVVSKISEETGATEEEIEEAMEVLGLTIADLSDPAKLAQLLNQISAEPDPAVVLTDADLFETAEGLSDQIGEILDDVVKVIADEFGISEDDAKALFENALKNATDTASAPEVQADIISEPVADADVVDLTDEIPVVSDNEEDVKNNEVIPEKEVPVEDRPRENVKEEEPVRVTENTRKPIENEAVRVSGPTGGNENAEAKNRFADTDNTGDHSANAGASNVSSAPAAQAPAPEQVEVPFESYTGNVNAEDIMDQINEYVRVNKSAQLTEMDIALNPASLGNIHLHLESREGVITATIGAANEAVRDVIASQIMSLKQDLNDQGIKVDAVEVTIASHEFERQMEGENSGDQAKEMMEREISKGQRRRLVINGLNDAEEMLENGDLSDEERLAVDMMARSGSSVDFTA